MVFPIDPLCVRRRPRSITRPTTCNHETLILRAAFMKPCPPYPSTGDQVFSCLRSPATRTPYDNHETPAPPVSRAGSAFLCLRSGAAQNHAPHYQVVLAILALSSRVKAKSGIYYDTKSMPISHHSVFISNMKLFSMISGNCYRPYHYLENHTPYFPSHFQNRPQLLKNNCPL